jgi:L-fuculokinase
MIAVTLIFDIGKTNKKILIFDDNLQIIEEKISTFEEILDDDGTLCDDLFALTQWMKSAFAEISANKKYQIKAVNFATYGASLVHLDSEGKPIAPLYNYLKDFPRSLHQQFFEKYGSIQDFCTATASPDLKMLNSGLQLYWLKSEKPQIFHQIKYSLHLPQYCSFVFTKEPVSEMTSIGCHTSLWDFQKNNYHAWLEAEHIHSIQQKPLLATNTIIKDNIVYGIGIHDSSAALVPYLKSFNETFVLISTGTWCISLNPFNVEKLTANELEKDALCYLTYEGKPVKASRLFAGNEHERHVRHLATYFKTTMDYYKTISFNQEIIRYLRNKFIQATPQTSDLGNLRESMFVERNLNLFKNYDEAYHQLMLDLVAQQVASTQLAIGKSLVRKIFVDGGFSKNDIFMNLLAEAFFDKEVYASEIAQATALGAAMVVSTGNLEKNNFQLKRF